MSHLSKVCSASPLAARCQRVDKENVPTPSATPPPVPQNAGPAAALSAEQARQLDDASRTHRALRRAARTAFSSAATTLFIGAASALCTAFSPDWQNVLISAAILAVGCVEYVGAARLRRADRRAAPLLMRNQLVFLAVIVLYSIIQLTTFSTDQMKKDAISPEVRQQLLEMPSMQQAIDRQIDLWGSVMHYGLYAGLIVVSILFQGGLAWYYASRQKHVEFFHRTNPDWARQVVTRLAA